MSDVESKRISDVIDEWRYRESQVCRHTLASLAVSTSDLMLRAWCHDEKYKADDPYSVAVAALMTTDDRAQSIALNAIDCTWSDAKAMLRWSCWFYDLHGVDDSDVGDFVRRYVDDAIRWTHFNELAVVRRNATLDCAEQFAEILIAAFDDDAFAADRFLRAANGRFRVYVDGLNEELEFSVGATRDWLAIERDLEQPDLFEPTDPLLIKAWDYAKAGISLLDVEAESEGDKS